MTTDVASLVKAAKEEIENLSIEQFESELTGRDVVVVDVREPEELTTTGCIAGAVHAPRGMLEFRADPSSPYHHAALDPSKRVLVYCATGGRSALAARTLQDMGYGDVAHLDGGMKAWIESQRPVDPR